MPRRGGPNDPLLRVAPGSRLKAMAKRPPIPPSRPAHRFTHSKASANPAEPFNLTGRSCGAIPHGAFMTQDERNALTAERADLQRKYQKRKGVSGYGASTEALLIRIEAIDAQLDAKPVEPEPVEQLPPLSLAGKTLGDPDATTTERRLAAKVLSDSRETIDYDNA